MPDSKWDLSRLSAGERSSLRRCAGNMMGDNMQSIAAFYKALLQNCRPSQEKAWYAAMCMESLWRDEEHRVRPLEEMLRSIYQDPESSESSRERCIAFMDLTWGDDGFLLGKICNLVRKMRSADASVMPDFDKLAGDLSQWNSPDKYIQRRWMKTICLRFKEKENNEIESNGTEDIKEEEENVD